jgi:DNA-binding MarR family transcriptional regulator
MSVRDRELPEAPTVLEPCVPAASLLTKLGRWSVRQFTGALKPLGLKARHFGTLLELRQGPLPQQTLGDTMGVDATQLVGFLNELEAEELVLRRRDPGDRRRHIVELSDLGRERLAEADRALADVDTRLMAGLSPAERSQFVTLLRFVAEHGGFDEECAGQPAVEPCIAAAAEAAAAAGDDF